MVNINLHIAPRQHINRRSTLFQCCGLTLKEHWPGVKYGNIWIAGFSTLNNVGTKLMFHAKTTLKHHSTTSIQQLFKCCIRLLQSLYNVISALLLIDSWRHVETNWTWNKYAYLNRLLCFIPLNEKIHLLNQFTNKLLKQLHAQCLQVEAFFRK